MESNATGRYVTSAESERDSSLIAAARPCSAASSITGMQHDAAVRRRLVGQHDLGLGPAAGCSNDPGQRGERVPMMRAGAAQRGVEVRRRHRCVPAAAGEPARSAGTSRAPRRRVPTACRVQLPAGRAGVDLDAHAVVRVSNELGGQLGVRLSSGSICSTSSRFTSTLVAGRPRASQPAASAISAKPAPGMTGWPCTMWSASHGWASDPRRTARRGRCPTAIRHACRATGAHP